MRLSNILKGWSKTKLPSFFNPTNENEAGGQFFGFITPQFLLMNQTWTRDQTRPDIEKTNVLNALDSIALFCDFYWMADDDLNGIYAWKFE